MEGGAYIAALLRLCRHSSEAVVRRALKLITTSVAKLSLQEQPETEVTLVPLCSCNDALLSGQYGRDVIVNVMLLMYWCLLL